MTVTVQIPFYGPEEYLTECVDSILAQTFRDFTVLIIGDGITVPHFEDPRIVSYSILENRGAYFCRQIALEATKTEWTVAFDADDWMEPTFLEDHLALARDNGWDAVHSRMRYQIEDDGRHLVRLFPKAHLPVSPVNLKHVTSHIGLYRTEVLRRFGGYNPGQRFGWDTLLLSLIRLKAKCGLVDAPLWHRRRHPDALTRRPDTRPDSPARTANHLYLHPMYKAAVRSPDPGAYLRSRYNPELVAEVEEHSAKVRELLPGDSYIPESPITGIPKILHTFWDGPTIPRSILDFISAWEVLNPEWDVRVWDEKMLLSGDVIFKPEELQVYKNWRQFSPLSNEWQYKSNIARLKILQKYGGVWFDADFEPLKPIDNLIIGYAPFVCRENEYFVNNGLLAFPPSHSFIEDCLSAMPSRIRRNRNWRSNQQNGPHLITDTIKRHPEVNVVPTELVYPLTYEQARSGLAAEDVDTSGAFAVHHWGNVRRKQGRPLT